MRNIAAVRGWNLPVNLENARRPTLDHYEGICA